MDGKWKGSGKEEVESVREVDNEWKGWTYEIVEEAVSCLSRQTWNTEEQLAQQVDELLLPVAVSQLLKEGAQEQPSAPPPGSPIPLCPRPHRLDQSHHSITGDLTDWTNHITALQATSQTEPITSQHYRPRHRLDQSHRSIPGHLTD